MALDAGLKERGGAMPHEQPASATDFVCAFQLTSPCAFHPCAGLSGQRRPCGWPAASRMRSATSRACEIRDR
jgi:hypothetical protein